MQEPWMLRRWLLEPLSCLRLGCRNLVCQGASCLWKLFRLIGDVGQECHGNNPTIQLYSRHKICMNYFCRSTCLNNSHDERWASNKQATYNMSSVWDCRGHVDVSVPQAFVMMDNIFVSYGLSIILIHISSLSSMDVDLSAKMVFLTLWGCRA